LPPRNGSGAPVEFANAAGRRWRPCPRRRGKAIFVKSSAIRSEILHANAEDFIIRNRCFDPAVRAWHGGKIRGVSQEAAMAKFLIGACLLVGLIILYDPPTVLGYLGPEANLLGWKIKSALDVERFLPGLKGSRG
jgi:hypothetical protein